MASDALIRANAVLPKVPEAFVSNQLRAALDPTDEAMVEAVAKALGGDHWARMNPTLRDHYRNLARAAIAAIRDHITGEGA